MIKGEFVTEVPDRFSIGLLTLPFKFRVQKEKAFDTDFNISSTLNVRITKWYNTNIYIQSGAGIGSTDINESNTTSSHTIEPSTVATLSLVSGLMIQYNRVQAGLYLGVDFINNNEYYQWDYNKKPWIGFGVGYQLFRIGVGGGDEVRKNKNK